MMLGQAPCAARVPSGGAAPIARGTAGHSLRSGRPSVPSAQRRAARRRGTAGSSAASMAMCGLAAMGTRFGLARFGARRIAAAKDAAPLRLAVLARAASSRAGRDPPAPKVLKAHRNYEGTLFRCSHTSEALGGLEAKFSVYVPDSPRAWSKLPYPDDSEEFPVLIYLSGMTCSDENVVTKANAQEHCCTEGLIFVAPDTSPRASGLAGEDDRWDFGVGAGYYLDATEEPWLAHYRMREYIEEELPALVHAHFPTLGPEAVSLMGHSMGGMGALASALRQPKAYCSVSALSPIAHPTNVPEGSSPDVRHALTRFLGDDTSTWKRYDPTQLAEDYNVERRGLPPPMLVDVGAEDEFLASVLRPMEFVEACGRRGLPVDFRLRAGYDHSYFYVASAMEEHILFHAKHLDS